MRVFAVAMLLAVFLPPRPASAGVEVGFSEVDVTPTLEKGPVYMAGFGQNRKATRIHDPIMARAIVLRGDTGNKATAIAIVSVDVVGLFLSNVETIRKQLPGFDYVLVSATHNHEGPDTLGLWGPNPLLAGTDPAYMKRLEDGCVEAVRKADTGRKRVGATSIGTATAPELIRDSRQPVVKHDELVAVEFSSADQPSQPLGVIVQWNCHPEVLDSKNTALTADFIHYTVKYLKEKRNCPIVYLTGTVGGLMTTLHLSVRGEDGKELADGTFEKSQQYGTLVGKLAEKALAGKKPVTVSPLAIRTREILIPVDNHLYRLGWQFGTLQRPLYEWAGNSTPKEFVQTKDVSKPVALKTEVGYLDLVDLEIAVIPGEIYPELVLGKVQNPPDPGADFPDAPIEPAIYPQMTGGKYRMIVGLGNDEIGYLIPKRQWDEKPPYCYGLKKPQYGEGNSVGPEAAPIICETFRDLVKGKKQ